MTSSEEYRSIDHLDFVFLDQLVRHRVVEAAYLRIYHLSFAFAAQAGLHHRDGLYRWGCLDPCLAVGSCAPQSSAV